MKPLTLEETALLEEMKERCLTKGQYIDENAKAKFEMLCHLEDFEVQYWELQQENKQLKMVNKEYERLNKVNNRGFKITNVKEYDIYDLLRYKENWNKLKEWLYENHYLYIPEIARNSTYQVVLNKMEEMERSNSDE